MSLIGRIKTWNAKRKQAAKPAYPEVSMRMSRDSSSTMADKIMSMMSGYSSMPTPYPRQILDGLDGLFTWHPYFRDFLTTMVALANTGHSLEISAPTEQKAKQALEVANNFAARCFPLSAGFDGAVNGFISQATRFGAICGEAPPDESMSELTQIFLVPVRTIEFTKDADGKLLCCQRQDGKLVPLNMVQTVWSIALPWDGSPYPVPPALAALQSVAKLRHFDDSLDGWLEKLSGLGVFLGTIANPPRDYEKQESDAAYQQRCFTILKQKAEAAHENLKKGFALGFENEKYTFQNTSAGAAGAQQLREMVCTSLFAGLGMDPTFFGHASKSPDTFAKVLFEVLIGRTLNIQNLVKRAMEHFHRLNGALNGLGDCSFGVQFERNRSLDAFMNNEAERMETDGIRADFAAGICDLAEARAKLGYDDESAKAGAFIATFNKRANRYEWPGYTRNQWSGFDRLPGAGREPGPDSGLRRNDGNGITTTNASAATARNAARQYVSQVQGKLSTAAQSGVDAVYEWARTRDVPEADLFVKRALEIFLRDAEGSLDSPTLEKIAKEHLTSIWHWARYEDDSVFGDVRERPTPTASIGFLKDDVATDYLARVDRMYVSKYVSGDERTSAQIQGFLKDQYLDKKLGIGKSEKDLKAFRDQFGELVDDIGLHRSRVILDTGVSRAENWGEMLALHDAEFTTFRIAGPWDSKTCAWCRAMQDKEFKVATEVDRIQQIIESGDEEIGKFGKFVTSRFAGKDGPASLQSMDAADVQSTGLVCAPIHPLCRHRVVCVVEQTAQNLYRIRFHFEPVSLTEYLRAA
jgi:hypothetical protein